MTRLRSTITAAVAAVALIGTLGACNVATSSNAAGGGQHHHKAATTTTKTKKTTPPKPKYTVAQQQAITSAKQYLSLGSGFSRAGLINQLSSSAGEGFKLSDAVFAVNHVSVSWNQQAVDSAQGYLKIGGFSRSSLIEQLSSQAGEQFTVAQATYAANKVGL